MNNVMDLPLAVLTTGVMIVVLLVSFVPIMPGPLLMWGIAIAFGVLDQFHRFTPVAAIVATVVMATGAARDLWLPLLGVRTGGLSCLTSAAAFVGGFIGTFTIPIPIIGTMAGGIIGALIVEFIHRRQMNLAVKAGKTVFKLQLIGYVIELSTTFGIFVVYIISLLTTR
jgi:uncharacterized protein YqgC (DUF456 family)